jgi:hypothetical protein
MGMKKRFLLILLAGLAGLLLASKANSQLATTPNQKDAKQVCEELCTAALFEKFDANQKKSLNECKAKGLCSIQRAPPIANMPFGQNRDPI